MKIVANSSAILTVTQEGTFITYLNVKMFNSLIFKNRFVLSQKKGLILSLEIEFLDESPLSSIQIIKQVFN